MRTRWILVLITVLGGGGWAFSHYRNGGASYEIALSTVEAGPITMTVETLGTIEPLSTVQVGCETTGKIVEILVDHDDPVTKDQVICRIDPELVDAQHAQSVAELTRARSSIQDAKIAQAEQTANLPVITTQAAGRLEEVLAALLEAAFNWKRVNELYKAGNATEAEWTRIKAQHRRAEAAVTIAEADLSLAKNNEKFLPKRTAEAVRQAEAAEKLAEALFRTTKAQVDRCVIRSPIDGIVLKRYMDVGTTVNPTFQTPTLFLIAPGLDRLRVNAKVSESDITHIEVGQKAQFTVEGRQRTLFSGSILHKRNQPDIVQNVVTYTVELEVNNDARRSLLPGMSVNVEIECVHRPSAAKISNAALRFKPPLAPEERRAAITAAQWPPQPVAEGGASPMYCKKAHAWRFESIEAQWKLVPLWVGVTDNLDTEVLGGAAPGGQFVKKFIDKSKSGFSFKEALKLASPDNRRL